MARTRPPGPDGVPLLGNALQYVRKQGELFENAAAHGAVVSMSVLGMGDLYMVTEPDHVDRNDVEAVVRDR